MNKFIVGMLATLAISSFALPASATPISLSLNDNLGPLDGGNFSTPFTSPGAGTGHLSFDLIGYISVDGSNSWVDTFTLTVNGTGFFSGGFAMGGGGATFVNSQASGVTFSTTENGYFQGGLTTFGLDFNVLAGNNTIKFDYGIMQGLSDEGWGVKNIIVTGNVSAVPVPTALWLLGSGLVGLMSWRKRNASNE